MKNIINFGNNADEPLSQQEKQNKAKETVELSPELVSFNLFFKQLFEELADLKAGYPLLFNMNLFGTLLKSNNKALNTVKQIKYSKEAPYFIEGSLNELTEIFDLGYATLCDILGPTNSDEIVMKVINKLKDTPEAQKFSVKQFL